MTVKREYKPYYWLNDESRAFLGNGYLLPGVTAEERIYQIAEHAEHILGLEGFAERFVYHMSRGHFSLSTPIWCNFGAGRSLPISCVTGDTWINTIDGGKMAKDIEIGDLVLTHKNRYRPVTNIIPTANKDDIWKLKITTRMTNLYITGNHPVLTNLGWVRVDELDPNLHLVAVSGDISGEHQYDVRDGLVYCPIGTLEKTELVRDVWDFTVEEDHSFAADGVILHNCFGSVVPDSVAGIMETATEIAMMGKEGGGTSAYFGKVRPRGSTITNNGKSDGSFSFLKIYESVIDVISQGTSRRSQLASYIDIDHGDIEEWLDIQTEGNPIQLSYYGVCVSNDWLEEMKAGDKYKRRIWAKVLQRRNETGVPYIFFKDNANNNKPDVYKDKNLPILASNMCVHGDSTILTDKGHERIGDIMGQKRTIWNGYEWSENIEIVKTGENQKLYRITVTNGQEERYLDCTEYHKWHIIDPTSGESVRVEAKDLQVGNTLQAWFSTYGLIEDNFYVIGIEDVEGLHDTFCVNEPKNHTVIFNNIMTGNCSEIMLPSNEEESFVCCLMSLNLLHYEEWKDTDAVKVATYFLDAVMSEFIRLAKNIPHLERAVRFAERHRALGIGALGWHSYLQSNMIPFESFQAMMKNSEIFKHIKEKSWEASKELAKNLGEPEILKGYGRRHTTTCVSGDTLVLTDKGNLPISELVGKQTTIWNGYEWSDVTPYVTGQKELYRVTFNDGKSLDCTSNHIFKVVSVLIDRTDQYNGRRILDVPLSQLRVGDVISKFKYPIIDGPIEFRDAYTQGFFSGDGSILHADRKSPQKEIRLYGSKMLCKDRIKWVSVRERNYGGRDLIRGHIDPTYSEKYTVPDDNCRLIDKLDWLAGIIDSDGYSSGIGIVITTAHRDFAERIVKLLTTVGCHSYISKTMRRGGFKPDSFYFAINISQHGCSILSDLGLTTERVRIPKCKLKYDDNPKFSWRSVVSIEPLNKVETTYCFTEPKRNTGIFNGIMTGQCAIAPTKSSSFILGAVSPSIEPFKSNYYIKDLAKGKTVFKNPYLVELLQSKGKDTEEVWLSILKQEGSVQHLDFLTQDEKDVFKTFGEINQLTIIQQAAQRQQFIDQGQSLNLTIHPNTPTKDVNQLYLTAAELGIKGLYYQFNTSAAQAFNRSLLTDCVSCSA